MNNRPQQRFDRSIRDAVEATRAANDAKPRRDVTDSRPVAKHTGERLQLMMDRETGDTVAAPWNHPDAVAWRASRVQPRTRAEQAQEQAA